MLKTDQKLAETTVPTARRPRILVIDDDEAIRKLLRFRLKNSYEIVDTGSPEDALALALETRPEVILLDLSMPKYSGIEVCGALGSLSITQKIPIVIVSGAPSDRYKEICENIGAKAYFQKPVDIDGLRKTLEQLIEHRRAEPHGDHRVKLKLALTLRATDAKGTVYDTPATTENVSANDFLATCASAFSYGATVEVFFPKNMESSVGKARVTRVDSPGTAFQRYDFRFTEKPKEWIVR
jgi:CheY-like chemotaxis protein